MEEEDGCPLLCLWRVFPSASHASAYGDSSFWRTPVNNQVVVPGRAICRPAQCNFADRTDEAGVMPKATCVTHTTPSLLSPSYTDQSMVARTQTASRVNISPPWGSTMRSRHHNISRDRCRCVKDRCRCVQDRCRYNSSRGIRYFVRVVDIIIRGRRSSNWSRVGPKSGGTQDICPLVNREVTST